MAEVKGLKLSENEVSQEVDLNDLFGVSLSGKQALKNEIAQDMIDLIKARTESGKSVHGTNLKKPYSKPYQESLDFKAFGKDANDINMSLTGNMLGTLDVLTDKGSKVKIGWQGDVEAAKAYNHNVGDTVPKRPFFGLNNKELEQIKKKYESQVKESVKSTFQSESEQIKSAILNRLKRSILG